MSPNDRPPQPPPPAQLPPTGPPPRRVNPLIPGAWVLLAVLVVVAAVYLLSDLSSGVTGENIFVDSGFNIVGL